LVRAHINNELESMLKETKFEIHSFDCSILLACLQGWVILYSEVLEKDWKEKHQDWTKRSRSESLRKDALKSN
jgi:hypothetical protein